MVARYIGNRLYRGEKFAMQIDSHMEFTNGWDSELIRQWSTVGNDMAILTVYVSAATPDIIEDGKIKISARPIMCEAKTEGMAGDLHLRFIAFESIPRNVGRPELEYFWAAGFSFARGHFVTTVPYDPYASGIFMGEELNIGVRAFTHGYDFYAPSRSVIFHHYRGANDTSARFWENTNRIDPRIGMERAMGVIRFNRKPEAIHANPHGHGRNRDKYGLGNVRSPELFYKLTGINQENPASLTPCPYILDGTRDTELRAYTRHGGIDYYRYLWETKSRSLH